MILQDVACCKKQIVKREDMPYNIYYEKFGLWEEAGWHQISNF